MGVVVVYGRYFFLELFAGRCCCCQVEVEGLIHYSLDGGTTKFMDLIQLVDFYQLNAGALPTQLNYYVTRLL